jgi:histidine triad (HIT) family protein
MTDQCIFCRIVAGTIPAKEVARTPQAVAFRDLHPQAPVHVLVIPTRHVASLATADDAAELGALLTLCADVARQEGLEAGGYRVVTNIGRDGGQTVGHLHLHVLGGRPLDWPPG